MSLLVSALNGLSSGSLSEATALESDLPWGMLVMSLLAGQIQIVVTLKAKEGSKPVWLSG